MADMIRVEVAYATPEQQKIVELEVEQGTTAQQAALQSGLDNIFPELDIAAAAKGIFGNALGARGLPEADLYLLKQGDRVEIYRPLIADPKVVRKQRAAEAAERRSRDKAV